MKMKLVTFLIIVLSILLLRNCFHGAIKARLAENPGFIKAMWCGSRECEDQIREETGATLRCIPFEQEQEVIGDGKCICCGKNSHEMAYFARAY